MWIQYALVGLHGICKGRGAACIENKCGFGGFFCIFLRFFFFNRVFLQDPFELAQLHENVTFLTVTPY